MEDTKEAIKESIDLNDSSDKYKTMVGSYLDLLIKYAEIQMKEIEKDTENLANVIKCHLDC